MTRPQFIAPTSLRRSSGERDNPQGWHVVPMGSTSEFKASKNSNNTTRKEIINNEGTKYNSP